MYEDPSFRSSSAHRSTSTRRPSSFPSGSPRPVSPLGASKFEQPFTLPRAYLDRHPTTHDRDPRLVSALGRLKTPPRYGHAYADSPITADQSSSFYSRDTYSRPKPTRPTSSPYLSREERRRPERRDSVDDFEYAAAGVDLSSYGGGPDLRGARTDRAWDSPMPSSRGVLQTPSNEHYMESSSSGGQRTSSSRYADRDASRIHDFYSYPAFPRHDSERGGYPGESRFAPSSRRQTDRYGSSQGMMAPPLLPPPTLTPSRRRADGGFGREGRSRRREY